MSLDARKRAHLLLLRVCDGTTPDWKTSRADARAALSLAMGVHPDDIDALGYERSAASYASSRASWVRHITGGGWHEQYDRPALDAVLADWSERLPHLTAGDDWFAEAWEAHLARYPQGCSLARWSGNEANVMNSRCDICQPVTAL